MLERRFWRDVITTNAGYVLHVSGNTVGDEDASVVVMVENWQDFPPYHPFLPGTCIDIGSDGDRIIRGFWGL